MKLRDHDEQPSRARDLAVAAFGFVLVLAAELVVCALCSAPHRETPKADCILDAKGTRF